MLVAAAGGGGGGGGGGGSRGWSGVPAALDHELVYPARWRAEQLKISALSGGGRGQGLWRGHALWERSSLGRRDS